MDIPVHGGGGAVSVSEAAFGRDLNESLVHQVVTAYLAGARAGTKAQKNRTATRGGGAKPWRQKGTGRARAGSIRSPLWRGGGKIFAAGPRDHSQKVNRKQYRAAMRSIVSELLRQERLTVVAELGLQAPKTRELAARLEELGLRRGLILTDGLDEKLYLAARNLPGVTALDAATVDPVSLVGADKVVATVEAVKRIEERLA